METLIKLTVRTPNNKFDDLQVDCDVRWTVRKLKEYLQDVYPSKPATSTQKLIYCGKLLQDHLSLREVFSRSSMSEGEEEEMVRTLHIVCAESSTNSSPPNVSSSQDSPTTSTEEGLRRRRTNQQAAQTATGSSTTPSAAAATPIVSHPASPPIMSQFSQPASPPIVSHFSQPASPMAAFYQQFSPSSPGAGAFLFPPASLQQHQMQMQAAYIQQWHQQQQLQQQQASVAASTGATSPMAAHAEWWRYYQQHMSSVLPMTPPPSATPQSIAAALPARTQAPAAHNLPPAAPVAAVPAAVGAPPVAAVAAAQNQNNRLNAGPGGAMGMADDDEENDGAPRDRDWLDYVYLLLRAVLTLGIVFFYSTTTRFALVCLLGFIVYLYQAGYFTPRPAVPLPANQQPAANPPVEGGGGGEERAAEGEHSTDETNDTPPVEPVRASSFRIVCTFVVSFFSSLVPQGVPPIQAN